LAEVPLVKIRLYLLSTEHPTGRAKAAFFRGLGFRVEAPEELRTSLVGLAREGKLRASSETAFGWKYVVDGHITGPSGVTGNIRSVWITEAESNRPRFVTAYPAPAEKA
jgi:hypothetical protein